MSSSAQLGDLLGNWRGINQLWLRPGEDAHESRSTAEVGQMAQGQFVTVAYTWAFDGEPQDGLLIFRSEANESPTVSAFLDSWHVPKGMMLCEGTKDQAGVVSLSGTYPAPPGPDWGWRIEIESPDGASLVLRMFNITPEGLEALAVLAQYQRPTGDS